MVGAGVHWTQVSRLYDDHCQSLGTRQIRQGEPNVTDSLRLKPPTRHTHQLIIITTARSTTHDDDIFDLLE